MEIPEWHKDIVKESIKEYEANPELALDFDVAMDEIEKSLN